MSGIAEVQARIADIEARIATFTGARATAVLPPSSAATGTAGRFADVLSATGSGSGAALVTRGARDLAGGTGTAAGAGTGTAGAGATGTGTAGRTGGTGAAGLAGTAPASGSTGERLLATARTYLGTPYKWGGTDPATGLDCSGLVQTAAKQLGIALPRTAAAQAKVGTAVPSLAQAVPGDLVVLENGHHIGIYVGNGQMLHAPKAGDVVKVSKVWETPMTIRRLGAAATTAAVGVAAAALLTPTSAGSTTSTTTAGYVRPASLGASASRSAPYDAAFSAAERKYGLPTGLLSAVARQESGYDPTARSSAGAVGLMQFMPATAKGMGIDPRDPAQAIDGAGKLLASHVKTFGSVPLALAAYNAGPGNVRKYGGIPPFAETQNYVKKILGTLATSGSTA